MADKNELPMYVKTSLRKIILFLTTLLMKNNDFHGNVTINFKGGQAPSVKVEETILLKD